MTEQVPTTCVRCAVGCGHVQQAVDRGYGLDVVGGDPAHPVNRGLACQRGVEETADPDAEWLTQPQVRRGGELVATTWDVALSVASEAIAAAADRDPHSVAVLGSGQQTNEAAYALGKLARGGIGTRRYDANTTLCMASAVTAYYDAFGSDAPPPTYDDIPAAESHVVWGANPAAAHPVMFRWIADSADEAGSELVVVDPVESETAEVADRHVSPDPGTDLALARTVLARIVETDRVDEAFVDEATAGFGDLAASLPDPAAAAETAGVPLETVDRLAAAFDRDALVYWGMGVNQSVQGTATAGALIDCCLATGNLGPGSGPFSLTGQANSMGTRVCSSKGTWPGHRPFDDPEARQTVADAWDVPVDALPDDPGPGPVGVVDAMAEGAVDVCWTVATNPAAGMPDGGKARDALSDAFLIVQDAFRSETVEHADVVLPASTWGETEGTVTNMERRVSRVRAATETPSGVRSDLDIVGAVADRVAPGLLDGPPTDPEATFDELAALTAGTPADVSGITYDRLDAAGAVRWPAPDATSEGGYRYRDGDDWSFETDSERARFSTGRHGGLPEPPDDDFPLTLTTGRKPDAYNTGVRARATGSPAARLNPATARAFGVEAGDGDGEGSDADEPPVTVASRRGSVEAAVELDEGVPDGVVWLPIHHPAVNELTLPATDPRSDEPNFKQCAVRLEAGERAASRAVRVPE
ncbi:molybdopterin oxidoreductase family protein [Halostella sp. JP-L12]|uniref:assimilatory nitrate reductase NasA n=1 Tax=Halostella TaxID=1843185 RepID=UPI000EF824F1|nr:MULTISPECIES: assimilatory nitrate reductase NasA [Halostella]NHN46054.1 molybdopterin oxidoreductase family protein [Halostella sp. JP-L12]